ncbi:MAG: GGDEF domain-containing protein [Lachnospiraceae bacterium]|nr:GGDEF domain-containing protein [Lachnospiraceae bacterium]
MEQIIIYVVGNPDLYPIEYYDEGTETFQGLIPTLLQEFSENTAYEIRYYHSGNADRREYLAEHLQVDIISGCEPGETFTHKEGEEIVLIESEADGQLGTYRILLSEVAPEALADDLRQFLKETTNETKTGILLKQVERQQYLQRSGRWFTVLGFVLLLLLFGSAVFLIVRRYRSRLGLMQRERETDALTGIGNMDYLVHCFPQLVNERNRILYSVYYFYVDAEHINRMSSRMEMDEILRYTAVTLSEYASDNDILARVSEGGFVIVRLSPGVQEKVWFGPALKRIREFAEGKGLSYIADIAVGIYRLQSNDWDLNEILFYASQGAQAAYQEGRDYKSCSEEFLQTLMEERLLQLDIERGLKYGQFHLYLQFYADASDNRILGGEALARWEHPEKGFLSSERFVPLMEREGLISHLDYYLLDKACAFLAKLHKEGVDDFTVAFHFSEKTLATNDFVIQCKELLNKYSFPKELLLFEFTENAMLKNREVVKFNMNAIRKLGIRTALDDFGEGFLALLDTREYPVDMMKLSKNLIDKLGTDMGDVILRAMIQVGHEIGVETYAEGIESDEQVELLREMHCDMLQDLRFHYPLPAWEVERKLLSRREGEELVRL